MSPRPKRLKVALDQCCSMKLQEYIEGPMGHVVVCRAKSAEPDESWLGRGFRNHADVYVTRDLACIIFGLAIGRRVITPPANASAKEIHLYVEEALDTIAAMPRAWI